jgi:hypothetical protein
MSNAKFKVCYDVKHVEKGDGIDRLLITKKSYFKTFKEAFNFSKKIYGMRLNGIEVIGRPSIESL